MRACVSPMQAGRILVSFNLSQYEPIRLKGICDVSFCITRPALGSGVRIGVRRGLRRPGCEQVGDQELWLRRLPLPQLRRYELLVRRVRVRSMRLRAGDGDNAGRRAGNRPEVRRLLRGPGVPPGSGRAGDRGPVRLRRLPLPRLQRPVVHLHDLRMRLLRLRGLMPLSP